MATMSSIWHTKKEEPMEDKTVFAQHKSFRDGTIECFMWEKQEFTDAIRKDVIAWCYLDDLIALETENKDLSDKIGKLETELEKTRKTLEQSEICCTEWEKQALDYKAENIALSGDLERTRKALEMAVDALKWIHETYNLGMGYEAAIMEKCEFAIEQITALEQKEQQ